MVSNMTELLRHSEKAYESYDDIFKAVLAGDSKVGKSKLLSRLVEDQFTSDYTATVGVDFGSKTVRSKTGKRMKLQLWDTSGQERFHSVTTAYFPGAHAILLVYDVTNARSFEHLQYWVREVESNCEDGVVLLVVGNKADQEELRKVNHGRAESFARQLGADHAEVSARTGHGVREVFLSTVDKIVRRMESETRPEQGQEGDPVEKERPRTRPARIRPLRTKGGQCPTKGVQATGM